MMARMFAKEEDEIIIAITSDAERQGIPMETAFIKASDELTDRNPDAVERRYRRIKNKGPGTRNGSISQSELMVIKLKALARDRSRHDQKVDMYKDKYLEAQKRYTQLGKDYQSLQKEHEALLESVRFALGEE